MFGELLFSLSFWRRQFNTYVLLYNKRLFQGRKLYWLIICLTQTAQTFTEAHTLCLCLPSGWWCKRSVRICVFLAYLRNALPRICESLRSLREKDLAPHGSVYSVSSVWDLSHPAWQYVLMFFCLKIIFTQNTRNTQNFASHGLQSVRYIKLFSIRQKHHPAVISYFCLL